MRIENLTGYLDADIKALVWATLRAKKANYRKISKVIVYRGRSASPTAWVLMTAKELCVRLASKRKPHEKRQLAQLLDHEIEHLCFDKNHQDMPFNGDWWLVPVPWAHKLPLRLNTSSRSRARARDQNQLSKRPRHPEPP